MRVYLIFGGLDLNPYNLPNQMAPYFICDICLVVLKKLLNSGLISIFKKLL